MRACLRRSNADQSIWPAPGKSGAPPDNQEDDRQWGVRNGAGELPVLPVQPCWPVRSLPSSVPILVRSARSGRTLQNRDEICRCNALGRPAC